MVEIDISMADRPPRKRRWFSFSLRTFLAGVFLIAIVLMPLAHRWHRYHQQKATIDSLENAVGVEYYRESRLPGWRYLLTNEQLADDVHHIHEWDLLNDGDLKLLPMFRRLETLQANGVSNITPLAELTQLKVLYLIGTTVTDITPLADLTQLRELCLNGTSVRDITPLAGLTQLNELYLDGTSVTDITPLAGLTQLKVLDLNGTSVTDITPLAALTQLNELYLGGTNVADITPLAGLTQLTHLSLEETSVTDLTPLAKLENVAIYVDIHEPDQLAIPVELQGRVRTPEGIK